MPRHKTQNAILVLRLATGGNRAMKCRNIQEMVSILMESTLYFDIPLRDRLVFINELALRTNWR
jgi:hypothetical protein